MSSLQTFLIQQLERKLQNQIRVLLVHETGLNIVICTQSCFRGDRINFYDDKLLFGHRHFKVRLWTLTTFSFLLIPNLILEIKENVLQHYYG